MSATFSACAKHVERTKNRQRKIKHDLRLRHKGIRDQDKEERGSVTKRGTKSYIGFAIQSAI